jgi:hypothetical protein
MTEATKKLVETSDLDEGSDLLKEATDNICSTWRQVFDLLEDKDIDKDTPLYAQILMDPGHPVCQLMLTIFSMETYVYGTLNYATKFQDLTKIQTMGPYAQVMNTIVRASMRKRTDIKEDAFKDIHLYRGTCLTDH